MAGRRKRAKGRLRESFGALTDNKRLKDKGRIEQAAGTARKTAGRTADKLRHAARRARAK
jgi:uncharacterized protein YjbJ (UPF0337 family)